MNKLPKLGLIFVLISPISYFLYRFLLDCDYNSFPSFSQALEKIVSSGAPLIIFVFLTPVVGVAISIIALFIKNKTPQQKKLIKSSLILGFLIIAYIFIVLYSLSNARMKGPYGNAQGVLFFARKSINIIKNDNEQKVFPNSNKCFEKGTLFEFDDIAKGTIKSYEDYTGNSPSCFSEGNDWAVSIELKKQGGLMCSNKTEILCSDSTGFSGPIEKDINSARCK